jgi:uncharacterized protein (DUF2345 family)
VTVTSAESSPKVTNQHVIRVTADGAAVDTHDNTVLRDHVQIVISYEGM